MGALRVEIVVGVFVRVGRLVGVAVGRGVIVGVRLGVGVGDSTAIANFVGRGVAVSVEPAVGAESKALLGMHEINNATPAIRTTLTPRGIDLICLTAFASPS
jgi:hypothetical protein